MHLHTQGLRYYIGVPEEKSIEMFRDYAGELGEE